MRRSDLVVFEDGPVRESSKVYCKAEIVALQDHIKNLEEQLKISNNDLVRLYQFLNQPLFDELGSRGNVLRTTYTAARQLAAIDYAAKTLRSTHNIVAFTRDHISKAGIRLELLKRGCEGDAYPMTINKLTELMKGVWLLHENVVELEEICKFSLDREYERP